MIRRMTIMVFPMIIFILSILSLIYINPLFAVLLYGFIPLSFLFFFGKVKDRLRNSVPLLMLMGYLLFNSIYYQWQETLFLFYSIPYIGLALKPNLHVAKYAVIIFTTVLLGLKFIFNIEINVTTRILYIVLIYLLFIPPFVVQFFNKTHQFITRKQ